EDLAIANLPIIQLGGNTRLADALHAVGALHHHAAAANGDVGIPQRPEALSVPVLIQEEVEPPHFVRTVVRAVPRADTAVVDHVVEALVAVCGRCHRTDDL